MQHALVNTQVLNNWILRQMAFGSISSSGHCLMYRYLILMPPWIKNPSYLHATVPIKCKKLRKYKQRIVKGNMALLILSCTGGLGFQPTQAISAWPYCSLLNWNQFDHHVVEMPPDILFATKFHFVYSRSKLSSGSLCDLVSNKPGWSNYQF